MSRPGVTRTASTNLGSGNGYRVLDGKVAIVTGASRGIGAATCENLASKGCSLIMNYTSDSSEAITTQLAERLQKEYGIKALPVQADMGTENGPAHLIATALNHFAHPKTRKLQIDIIINNAGVASNRKIEDCDAEDFDFVYRVNVRGPLFLMKAALPYLPTDRSGRIVNVSSVSASCGFSEQSVYGGSKAAVEAMTRTWARELAERTTVNAINPGPVMTDMWSGVTKEFQEGIAPWLKNTPLAAVRPGIDSEDLVKGAEVAGGRPAYESETAGVIAMLCTPDAAYTTGSVISCNGGFKFMSLAVIDHSDRGEMASDRTGGQTLFDRRDGQQFGGRHLRVLFVCSIVSLDLSVVQRRRKLHIGLIHARQSPCAQCSVRSCGPVLGICVW
ncbi:NAD(P)-binding protein, partial [Aureobasidium melanogenum]